MKHWVRITAVGAASLVVLFAAYGSLLTANRSIADRVGRMDPGTFFSDPVQVRLAEAVDRGDLAGVAAAVQAGADVDARGRDGYALLYWAMARGRVAGFEALVKHGADVTGEYRDPSLLREPSHRDVIIRLALSHPDPEFLRAVLRHGFDPDHVLSATSGESLLVLAGSRHAEAAMQSLLDAGADVDHQDVCGYTPLVSAMQRRDFNTARFLLERGADPTIRDASGHDASWQFKEYGSRGVRPDQRESFDTVVADLVGRGLLTRQDIVDADRPKRSALDGPPGVTVIEHSWNSEPGRTVRRLERMDREAGAPGRR